MLLSRKKYRGKTNSTGQSRFTYCSHNSSKRSDIMASFLQGAEMILKKLYFSVQNCCVLQVVTNRDTQETLLCIAYVFEVSASEHGAQHHIYRLVKD